jgi:hypothetical protein
MDSDVDIFFFLILILGIAFWGGLIYLVVRFLKRQRNQSNSSPTVQQFLVGELGLAKTFWLGYFVVPNVLFLLIYWTTTPGSDAAIAFVVGWFVYVVAASVAVWRAAGNFTGLKVWAWLARALVAMPIVGVVLALAIVATTSK